MGQERLPLRATPAWESGLARSAMCAECGVLVYVPECGVYAAGDRLGGCPRCGGVTWWKQRLPVGPFVPPIEKGKD